MVELGEFGRFTLEGIVVYFTYYPENLLQKVRKAIKILIRIFGPFAVYVRLLSATPCKGLYSSFMLLFI
jgi:hypothetical protein